MSSIVLKGKNPLKAIRLLQKSTIVCFDVDSTLSRHEGLEELSEFIGTPQTIAKIKEITTEYISFFLFIHIHFRIPALYHCKYPTIIFPFPTPSSNSFSFSLPLER